MYFLDYVSEHKWKERLRESASCWRIRWMKKFTKAIFQSVKSWHWRSLLSWLRFVELVSIFWGVYIQFYIWGIGVVWTCMWCRWNMETWTGLQHLLVVLLSLRSSRFCFRFSNAFTPNVTSRTATQNNSGNIHIQTEFIVAYREMCEISQCMIIWICRIWDTYVGIQYMEWPERKNNQNYFFLPIISYYINLSYLL